MKEKGFVQISLAIIIIFSITAALLGTAVFLYKQGKLSFLAANISKVFRGTSEIIIISDEQDTESLAEERALGDLPEGSETTVDEEARVDYEEILEQLQQELVALQQQQNKIQNQNTQDGGQWELQNQVVSLQQQLQQMEQENQESQQIVQQTGEESIQQDHLQGQIANLQQQLQEAEQRIIQELESKPVQQIPQKLDINQLVSRVVKVECSNGSGSGFLINSDGYVVTNYHVVEEPMYEKEGKIYRSPVSGLLIPGCIVSFTTIPSSPPYIHYWASLPGAGVDEEKDLAILYIQAKLLAMDDLKPLNNKDRNFSFIPKCSQSDFEIGDEITVLGYPSIGKETITITNGIISGSLGIYYKLSAKISFGNSGGPVVFNNNQGGCYIGVVRGGLGDDLESLYYAVKAKFVPF